MTTFNNIILRINCNKEEDGLKTTPDSQYALNALAIGKIKVEYKRCAWYNRERN